VKLEFSRMIRWFSFYLSIIEPELVRDLLNVMAKSGLVGGVYHLFNLPPRSGYLDCKDPEISGVIAHS